MNINSPQIFVSWYDKEQEAHCLGPFYTVSIAGVDVLTHNWFTLEVQNRSGAFRKITVPTYFSIGSICTV